MSEHEFYGYLTMILSALVTVLIGFQIASYIMIGSRIRREIKKQISQARTDIAKENVLLQVKTLDISIRGYMEAGSWNMVIFSIITKINYLIEIKDVMRLDDSIEFIESLLNKIDIASRIEAELKTRLTIALMQSLQISARAYGLLKRLDS